MIVYSATKAEFNNDVIMNSISDKILNKLIENNIHGGQDAEYRAWQWYLDLNLLRYRR